MRGGGSDYPTKSGVVLLLASALGYGAGDSRIHGELEEGLRFGVRVESAGRIMRDEIPASDILSDDRQSQQAGSRRRQRKGLVAGVKVVSSKEYMLDASFLVALELIPGAPADLLARCAAALIRPAAPVLLGRRSCPPTRPVFERLTMDFDGIESALSRFPWGCEISSPLFAQDLIAYIEPVKAETDGTGGAPNEVAPCIKRMIVPLDRLIHFGDEKR
jgi:CRISPR system Cascade subunit CasD